MRSVEQGFEQLKPCQIGNTVANVELKVIENHNASLARARLLLLTFGSVENLAAQIPPGIGIQSRECFQAFAFSGVRATNDERIPCDLGHIFPVYRFKLGSTGELGEKDLSRETHDPEHESRDNHREAASCRAAQAMPRGVG